MIEPDWPANCPPDDADALPLVAFRCVNNCPPIAPEFFSYFEEGKVVPGRECECRGVSLFVDVRDAEHHLKLFKSKTLIATGTLGTETGKAKKWASKKFPSHVTWWPLVGLIREQLFKVLK